MRKLAPLVPLLLASACTMGPTYAGPPAPTVSGAVPAAFARSNASSIPQAPAVAAWWTVLDDALLNQLEDRALAANPNIAVATARLNQARAALRLDRANQAPSVSAEPSYVHAEVPALDLNGEGGGKRSSFDFFNTGFDASWEIDLSGGQRRTVEASRASLGAAEANVADAQVRLTADVAQAYIGLRDVQQRLALANRNVEIQRQMLALTKQRFDQGTASSLDIERLQNQVDSTVAQLVPLGAEIDSYKNALAVLVGEAPGTLDTLLEASGPIPVPPAQVPIGDPAELLQRRPDIRAAERQLAAQTARIGVAEAARFPHISLMGIIGFGGTKFADAFDPNQLAALATPQIQWNFLDFGRGAARVHQAEAARDEAEASYRSAVLQALKDAEDSLSRFGNRRSTLASLLRVRDSARRAATLTGQRQRAGTASLIDALDAERQRVSAEQNVSQTTAAVTGDFVALQKALGLGWSSPTPQATRQAN